MVSPLLTETNYVLEPHQPQEDINERARKAGRPRLGAGAVLSEDRRKQVRRAQRTYRLKKEATLQQTKQRVVDLENKFERVSSAFADLMQGLDPSVKSRSPALVRRLDAIYALLADGEDEAVSRRVPQNRNAMDETGFETQSYAQRQSADPASTSASTSTSTSSPNPNPHHHHPPLPLSITTTTMYTSSHHEKTLPRHLHRLSLEHAFHLFNDPRTHPLRIYQVFRLVPCIQDRSKMDPYFRRLVSAGADEALEIPSLPFYGIGGAGAHYPARDGEGRPVYPVNSRMPRRVLGGLFVDRSASEMGGRGGERKRERYAGQKEEERRLQAYGLGGVWFDCRDVEGYLKEMGVRMDGGLFPGVMQEESPRDRGEGGNDSDAEEQLQTSLLDSVMEGRASDVDDVEPSQSSKSRACRRILDMDSFLSKLLQGLVILGRAPGFRRSDVVSAFHSALVPQTI
ncbi:hypothetical protein P170DRAFT_378384 [Aspergillus steynii IBT 23096]|uniref:BZIP domain-containing protein n=1 Tax=Aspergillus steynii IBT 23096 TaxID=1392250 RepID=A0A2I2GI30_9EURO|nr:uncharacterized protein P170DRAFT_378384 [Aspergillus steynii IBT 23096]PLB52524.1 hypothetical protein P170DRAFT_378384 [Aspergillus steynii IBT 23096]